MPKPSNNRRTKTPIRTTPKSSNPLFVEKLLSHQRLRIITSHTIFSIFIATIGYFLFSNCLFGLEARFSDYSQQVQAFAKETPVQFQSYVQQIQNNRSKHVNVSAFQSTTAKWHHDLRTLQDDIENKFRLEFELDIENDNFVPVCANVRLAYLLFIFFDSLVLFVLFLVILRILYKDMCTIYGANRHSVKIQFHVMLAAVECFIILNLPLLNLSMSAVDLSHQFKTVVDELKKIQVLLLVGDDPTTYNHLYLRASIWQGKRFGVRVPLSNTHLDDIYNSTLKTRAYLLTFFIAVGISILMYRASIRSVTRWRRNVNAVCSIGIVVPTDNEGRGGKTIFRVGSGVLVSGSDSNGRSYQKSKLAPLIVTNWHCLHDIVDVSKSASSQSRTNLKLRTHVNVLQSTTSITRKSCSYDAPGWKILIGVRDVEGTGGKEDIRWLYTGKTVVESPMREFAEKRIDMNRDLSNAGNASNASERSGGTGQRESSRTGGGSSTGGSSTGVGGGDERSNGNGGDSSSSSSSSSSLSDGMWTSSLVATGDVENEENTSRASQMKRQQSELYQPIASPSTSSQSQQSSSQDELNSSISSSQFSTDYLSGIDITVLQIENQIKVHGLRKSSNNRNYTFDSIESSDNISNNNNKKNNNISNNNNNKKNNNNNNNNNDLSLSTSSSFVSASSPFSISKSIQRLPRFDAIHDEHHTFGRGAASLSVRMSDQLRLMGYPPDAGGYDMSILTTFFTGVDYEDRQRNEGRYLLANSVLPIGFSGGAAVNEDGELVGICTMEHGNGISCIRDYVDVKPLVTQASLQLINENEKFKQALQNGNKKEN